MQNNIIEIFENEARVSHRVIAERTNNKILSVQKLITDNITILEEFGRVRFKIEGDFEVKEKQKTNPNYRAETTYYLNEQQTTLVLTFMRNNEIVKEFKINLVREFYKMREILQNAKPQLSENYEKVQTEIFALKSAIEILLPSQASKILMTETLYKDLGLKSSYLPKYSDENHTYSLSALLKKFEVGISANKMNKLLISKEFLETKTRKSSKTEENEKGEKIPVFKEFKSLTEKGLEFGKNMISPQNQRETQPHYFENKFQELLDRLNIQKTLL